MAKAVLQTKAHEAPSKLTGETTGPALPEGEPTRLMAKRRKRLAKVFARPLEKEHKEQQLVREKYSIPPLEYDQLLEVRLRLAARGVPVKKSELVRAGLMLLAAQDDHQLRALLMRVRANT